MTRDSPYFAVQKETCLSHLTSHFANTKKYTTSGNPTRYVTMARSPRDHVISQFLHCRFRPTKRPSLPTSIVGFDIGRFSLVNGLEIWLDHMLDPDNRFETMDDSFHCYTPWNLQSRMLTCSVNVEGSDGAQVILSRYMDGSVAKPPKEPKWTDVQRAMEQLDFIGVTEKYFETWCIMNYVHGGCPKVPTICDCRDEKNRLDEVREELVHTDYADMHLLDSSLLNERIYRKIDLLTMADTRYYQVAVESFQTKQRQVEGECGFPLTCQV